jgi:dTDP-L-rhamnose 4-epimerase
MLDAIARSGHLPRRVLLTSSRAVYGEGTWEHADGTRFQPGPRTHAQLAAGQWDFPDSTFVPCSASETPPDPSSVYGATKLAQENVLSAWCGSHDTPLTVLRLQNVIGPGQSLDNPYTGIVVLFARWARKGRSIPVFEDGLVTRDFVHVDDVVGAIGSALDASDPSPGYRVHPLDVGSGLRTTLIELTTLVAEQYDAPAPTVTGQFRDGDVRHAGCDVAPTTAALGWQPRRGLREAVTEVLQWVEHRLQR